MDIIMDINNLNITPEILKLIAGIDEFKGRWQELSILSRDQLNILRKVATIQSIGSSTRIEGAKLSDREVEELLSGLQITSFNSRDEEEIAGYSTCLGIILDSFESISISENYIKQLHQELLKFSAKDVRHRGEYKQLPNHVEAFDASGKSLGIIFETVSPFATPTKMAELIAWLNHELAAGNLHHLLLIAVFIVHFLAIHPFQDGNGRLSRLLTTLLMLKTGYSFVPYCSLEKIIEENKEQYYLSLRKAQQTVFTDNSTLNTWIIFFLKSICQQVTSLSEQATREELLSNIPLLTKQLLAILHERGRLTVRDGVQLTGANRNTVKAHLAKLVKQGKLQQEGIGKGTWYRPV